MNRTAKGRPLKDDYVIYSKNKNIASVLQMDEFFIVGLDPAIRNFAMGIESRKKDEAPSCVTLLKFSTAGKNPDHCNNSLLNCTRNLNEYREWWPHINIVLVERQLPGKACYQLYQHAISYFLFNCPDAIVMDINPKIKGRMLGAPANLNYTGLKKWSVQEGKALLEERGDEFGLKSLKGQKLDDMCDVVCEIEGFLRYLENNFPNKGDGAK